jgi:formamidopyrimidine-DNA glycosylase
MFELPEYTNFVKQMNASLAGKTIQNGQLGNSPHKFVWYNREPEEFERLTKGKVVGEAWVQGRWLFIPLEPGYVLLFGECGGKILTHTPGEKLPKKYHLYLTFEDESFLTATTQMWGAYELYQRGDEQNREYVKGMRTTPVEAAFTFDYFDSLIDELLGGKKRSAKSLLTQDQIIPGLGNASAQDILFRARLSPKHPIEDLNADRRRTLYDSIVSTVTEIIEQGGRYDEYDLYGNRGGYIRLMDKNAVARPCPECGGEVKKIQYLGGACYLCPNCQG